MNIGTLTATLGVNTMGLYQAEQRMKAFETTTMASMKKMDASLKRTGMAMKKFGKSAKMYLTLPLALIGGASFVVFKKYEVTLSRITGLVGIAAEQTKKWSKQILAMAPGLAKGPTELAKALFFITSAGIKGAQAMNVLKDSAEASTAGLGETKVVADLVTSAMNAYGTANLSAARATDVLVATVREGKAEPAELASSMGMVLPIAAAMGVKFNQVGAAMAAMTRTGTHASTAAMQLRQILAAFLKPTSSAEKVLEGMGTSLKKVKAGFQQMGTSAAHFRDIIAKKGLLAALLELKKFSDKYGTKILAKIFPNIRALSGILDILGKNISGNIEIFKQLSNATGSLKNALAAASVTAEFQWNKAITQGKVTLITLGKTISEAFLPILKGLVSRLHNVTKWFYNLSDSTKKMIVGFGGILLIVGPVVAILGFLATNVMPGLIFIGMKLIKMFDLLKMAMLENPITAWIVGITMAIAVIYEFTKKTNDAADSQRKLTKEFLRAQKLTKDVNNIKSYIAVLSTMNKQQLNDFQQRIIRQIKLEKDSNIKMLASKKEMINHSKIAMKVMSDWHKKDLLLLAGTNMKVNKKIVNQNNDSYTERLKLLNNYLRTVKKALKTLKSPKPQKINGQIITVTQGKIIDEMNTKLTFLNKLNKAFGGTIDQVSTKVQMYSSVIEALISNEMAPMSNYIQKLIGKLNSFKNAQSEMNASTKILANSLAKINSLQMILGSNYDGITIKLALFNKILKEGISSGKMSIKFYNYLTNAIKNLNSELQQKNTNTIFSNIPVQLQKASINAKIFGSSFDFVNQQMNIYSNALRQLQEIGGPFTQKQLVLIQQYSDKLVALKAIHISQIQEIQEMGNAFQSLGNAIGGTTGEWLSWIGNVLNTLPKVLQMLTALGLVHTFVAKTTDKNTKATIENSGANILNTATITTQTAVKTTGSVIDIVKKITTHSLTKTTKKDTIATGINTVTVGAQSAFNVGSSMVLIGKKIVTNSATNATIKNSGVNLANAGTSAIQAAGAAGASVANATKSGSSLPFPFNLIAIALGVAAVVVALASIPKAKASTHMSTGGIIPDGYSGDNFPAMLKSRELVIPLDNLPNLLQNISGGVSGNKIVNFRLRGRELEATLNNQTKYNDIY